MSKPKSKAKKVKELVRKIVPFNKKNAIEFANHLYNDSDGKISFTKLCKDTLRNGLDGRKRLHCGLGEAHVTFLEPILFEDKIQNEINKIYERQLKEHISKNEKNNEYNFSPTIDDPESYVVERLVAVAKLKSKTLENKLRTRLREIPGINDDSACSDSIDSDVCGVESYINRAMELKAFWMKNIVPLLK